MKERKTEQIKTERKKERKKEMENTNERNS